MCFYPCLGREGGFQALSLLENPLRPAHRKWDCIGSVDSCHKYRAQSWLWVRQVPTHVTQRQVPTHVTQRQVRNTSAHLCHRLSRLKTKHSEGSRRTF